MTATLLALVGLFGCFVLYHFWCETQWSRERARLIGALGVREPTQAFTTELGRARPTPKPHDPDDDEWALEPIGYSG